MKGFKIIKKKFKNSPKTSEPFSIATESRFLSPQNRFLLPQNRFLLPQKRFLLPQNRFLSPQNRFLSPQKRFLSPQNRFLLLLGLVTAVLQQHFAFVVAILLELDLTGAMITLLMIKQSMIHIISYNYASMIPLLIKQSMIRVIIIINDSIIFHRITTRLFTELNRNDIIGPSDLTTVVSSNHFCLI